MFIWTASVPLAHGMSERDARGPEDNDAPLWWRGFKLSDPLYRQ